MLTACMFMLYVGTEIELLSHLVLPVAMCVIFGVCIVVLVV